MQYNRGRYYDPAAGRWTQEDPIGLAAGDANPYRYVGNAPTNATDPTGLDSVFWAAVGGGIRGLGQGALNIQNGLNDAPVGLANLAVWAGNNTLGRLPGVAERGYYQGLGDWSNGVLADEDPFLHNASKVIGSTGVTLPVGGGGGLVCKVGSGLGGGSATLALAGGGSMAVGLAGAGGVTVGLAPGALAGGVGLGAGFQNLACQGNPGGSGQAPSRPAPAPDNYRGRYMADRHAQGKPRLPDDWDVHHRIPQKYVDHPEFQGFDFHQPRNLQGVKGSRADANVHQGITNAWEEFGRQNPNATRAQIENFANQIDALFSGSWFK